MTIDQVSRTRRAAGRGVGGGGSEGGCATPLRATLADRVYELSSRLGALRRRSVLGVDALRSAAEGVPELEQALEPLLAAVEAGLSECHEADVAAVFGRPMTSSQGLLMPSPADRKEHGSARDGGGGGRGGGGTLDATKHLARAISALESDVSAVEALAKHGYTFRTIAKWAARQSTASTPAATSLPPPRASVLALSRPMHATRSGGGGGGGGNDGRRGAPCDGDIGRGGEENDDGGEEGSLDDAGDDWTMRVFRARAAGARDADAGGRGGGDRGGARRSFGSERGTRRAASGSTAAVAGAASALACPPPPPGLVVVKALRASLPPVPAPWPLPMASGDRVSPTTTTAAAAAAAAVAAARGQGGRDSGSAQGGAAVAGGTSAWHRRGPLSWLGGGFRGAGRSTSAAAELPPPPRPTEPPPPRVVVRVVYAAHALDMLRLAEAATAAARMGGRGADGGQPRRCGSEDARASWPSVELLRSEVRARPVDGTGGSGTCTRQGSGGEGEEFVGGDGEGPRPRPLGGSAIQLQVVLRLRTSTPVVVSRLLHSGGHVVTPPRGEPSESAPSCAVETPPVGRAPAGGARAMGSVATPRTRRGGRESTRCGGEREGPTGTRDGVVGVGDGSAKGGLPAGVPAGGRGGDAEKEKGDVVPSAWGEAPAGLCPPEGVEGGLCEAGTDHLLGVNIVLPSAPRPPSPPLRDGRRSRGTTPTTITTNADTTALPQPPLSRAAADPSTLSGAAVDSHGDDQRRQRAGRRTGGPQGLASGKKRPRPEVCGGAGRGGRGGGGVAKVRRLGEGDGGTTPSAACAGDVGGGSASGDEKENQARESSNNNSNNNNRGRSRRKKAGWGWGFLRLWRRADDEERGGGEEEDTDGGGSGGGGEGETSADDGAALPAGRVGSTMGPRISDGSRQNQQQPLLNLGCPRDGDMAEPRENEEEEEGGKGDPPGRRSNAAAAPPPRRSALVVTVVLAPPPPTPPDALAAVDAQASC